MRFANHLAHGKQIRSFVLPSHMDCSAAVLDNHVLLKVPGQPITENRNTKFFKGQFVRRYLRLEILLRVAMDFAEIRRYRPNEVVTSAKGTAVSYV